MRVPTDRRVVDMLEQNNLERFRARRLAAHRRTAARKGESAFAGSGPWARESRSLPSGPAAPTPGGLVLSLLLMGVGVVALGIAFTGLGVAWGLEQVVRRGK